MYGSIQGRSTWVAILPEINLDFFLLSQNKRRTLYQPHVTKDATAMPESVRQTDAKQSDERDGPRTSTRKPNSTLFTQ